MITLLLVLALVLPVGSSKGPKYEVYRHDKVVKKESSVWFNTRQDYERFVYRSVRKHAPRDDYQNDVSKQGALLAVAHARKAGGHWLNAKNKKGKTRGPLKGFNLWGITAGKLYKKNGGRYFVKGKTWRYYSSAEKGVDGWFFVVSRLYPKATAQYYRPKPNVKTYVVGLCHGEGGRAYMKCPRLADGKLDPEYLAGWVNDLKVSMSFAQNHLEAEGFVF